MAKIKLSGIVSDISGKIGGTIFQRSQSGYTMRNLTYPVNKKTPGQEAVRNITNTLQQSWLNLSQAQRDIWQSFSRYNTIKQKSNWGLLLNGHQVFLKLNHYRLLQNLPLLVTPEFLKCEFKVINLTLELRSGRLIVISDRELIPEFEFLLLFLTSCTKKSINNPGSSFRFIKGSFTEPYENDITDQYFAVFSRIPESGQQVFFKFSIANKESGLIKPFFQKKVIL